MDALVMMNHSCALVRKVPCGIVKAQYIDCTLRVDSLFKWEGAGGSLSAKVPAQDEITYVPQEVGVPRVGHCLNHLCSVSQRQPFLPAPAFSFCCFLLLPGSVFLSFLLKVREQECAACPSFAKQMDCHPIATQLPLNCHTIATQLPL